ncbi:MAG TPA: hypothetical protein VFH37_00210 [Candidatus Saccharimonadales bacterium]|nr:hypothetical protein [Candidatus Saccharimonadales bacterium]
MRRAGNQQPKERGTRSYNRTPLTTYYRADKAPNSPFQNRPPKKSPRRYLFGVADLILIVVLIAALVYSLILRAEPAVMASSQAYRTNSQYASLIQTDFSGLSNKNKITFNETSVVNHIQQQFPEVSAARVELPFFSEQPKVRLLVSPPAFKIKSSSKIYIVDEQGMVVTDQYNQRRFADLPTVEDQSGFRASVGKPVLSSTAASFISTVIKQCQRAKVPLAILSLPPVPQEFDLRTKDKPYYVKFYLGGDPNIQSGQYLAARQKFAQAHISPSQYLDVRVAGKIFYK